MRFLSERFWFQRRGDDFVFRLNVFSRGYLLSREEKDSLLEELLRSQRQMVFEALGVISLAAVIALSGDYEAGTVPQRLVVAAVAAILVYAPFVVLRQHRLVARCLGGKAPTLDRLPLRQAMVQPRPLLKKHVALKVIRLFSVVFVLGVVVVDALLVSAFVVSSMQSMGDDSAAAAMRALVALVQRPDIWLLLVAVDAPFGVIYAGLVLIRRHWHTMPDEP